MIEHYFLNEKVKIIEQFKKKTDKFPRFKIWVLILETYVYWGEFEAYHVGGAISRFIDEEIETFDFELYGIPEFKEVYVDKCFNYGATFKKFKRGDKIELFYLR